MVASCAVRANAGPGQTEVVVVAGARVVVVAGVVVDATELVVAGPPVVVVGLVVLVVLTPEVVAGPVLDGADVDGAVVVGADVPSSPEHEVSAATAANTVSVTSTSRTRPMATIVLPSGRAGKGTRSRSPPATGWAMMRRHPHEGRVPVTDAAHRAYEGFGGRVERELSRSTPWWPPRPSAPTGAPNVVVVLVDDLGYSDLGCYGSEIPTPNVDALAANGVQFTNFHAQPSCSPTRASLLTGQECHAAGFGFPAQFDPGYPGHAMELPDDVVTLAEVLRANGYTTMMTGKWHLSREADGMAGGDRRSWPCRRGFDRFYGFLDGFTDHHHPHQIIVDNTVQAIDEYPPGYYLADDLTDRAIDMIREAKTADPSKPFFCYLAHGAVHAPLQAKSADIARHADRYHVGWDTVRAERFARQQESGVVAPGTVLPVRNSEPGADVAPWDDLTDDERTLFARYMAVYAAMVDNIDQNLGRLLAALDELGVRDDTVVLFLSDNGASREGGSQGTTAYLAGLHTGFGTDLAADLARLDDIGSERTHPHYPRGWAMASNTPNRLYKISTHAGGHTVPCVVSWPRGLDARGLRRQYAHVVDVLPTLAELIGFALPDERHGVPLRPVAGRSFASVLRDPGAPEAHLAQHYESMGNVGYYRDGWEVVAQGHRAGSVTGANWELYDLTADPTETRNLAAEHPERVAELAEAFDAAAWASLVYPVVDDFVLYSGVRPPSDDALVQPLRIFPGTSTIDRYRSARVVQDRSFRIEITLAHQAGAEGVLVSHGSLGGGYELAVDGGLLVYTHNHGGHEQRVEGGPVPSGTAQILVDVTAEGAGRCTVALFVDGAPAGRAEGLAGFSGLTPLEGIDVGRSRRSPVSWTRHVAHGAWPYTGTLHHVTYVPGELAPDAPESIARTRLAKLTTFD